MSRKKTNVIADALALLGHRVRDVITGFEGVVESVGFDLYGCVQVVIRPVISDKGEMQDGRWLDLKRVEQISTAPVMAVPAFVKLALGDETGPADKPLMR